MGAFASSLASLGGLGNDLASAKQANSTQAFTDQLNALKLRQLQLALSQSGQPKPEGTIGLPGGGTAGLTFDPSTGKFTTQTLAAGMDPAGVKAAIAEMAKDTGPNEKNVFDSYVRAIDLGTDPAKILSSAQQYNASISRMSQKGWQVKTDAGGQPVEITGPDGSSHDPFDPKLPPEAQAIVKRYQQAVATALQQKKDAETNTLTREETLQDRRESASERAADVRQQAADQKQADADARKAAQDVMTAFSKYQAVQQQGITDVGKAKNETIFNPFNWGDVGVATKTSDARSQTLLDDFEDKLTTAIDAYQEAGKPSPPWMVSAAHRLGLRIPSSGDTTDSPSTAETGTGNATPIPTFGEWKKGQGK